MPTYSPPYRESNLTITLISGEHFRFGSCRTYISLSGQNLKEMDFAWWNSTTNTLWFLELKDYSTRPLLPSDLVKDLSKKATDVLLMLSSVWINSLKGQQLCSEILTFCPVFPTTHQRLKLIFVIKLGPHHSATYLDPLQTDLRNYLRGYTSLFDLTVNDVLLIDPSTATRFGLPVAP